MQKITQQIAEELGSELDTIPLNKHGKHHMRLSKQSCSILSDLMAKGFIEKVLRSANALALYNQRNTLKPSDLLYGARVNVPDETLRGEMTAACNLHIGAFDQSYEDDAEAAAAATETKA